MTELKKPKRMMKVEKRNEKYFVEINSSSLDLLQTCMRKSYYKLHEGLSRSVSDSTALAFGSAIHKALEHWYSLPQEARKPSAWSRRDAELICAGASVSSDTSSSLNSIQNFYDSAKDSLGALAPDDKRSLVSGGALLLAYFSHYANDGLEVVELNGEKLIEKEVEFELWDDEQLNIKVFGTIDMIVQDKETGIIMIADHKTTTSLGTEFYSRCKPNFQYCLYTWAAQRDLGLNTNLFMVNGIQVAKTKKEFARQVVEFNEEDFLELSDAIKFRVIEYIMCLERGIFPMSTPNSCAMWGGCTYLDLCSAPKSLRANIIEASFVKQ